MISKELLSEVLGLDVYEDGKKFSELSKINSISNNVNYDIRFLKCIERGWTDAVGNRFINIHELAHKCKEWAFDNFYLSIIVFKMNDNLYKCEISDIRDNLGERITKHSFKIDAEAEAIFQACQWILDNKDK